MKFTQFTLALCCGFGMTALAAEPARALRALYISGGCCHDYNRQKVIIPEGVSARANVEWTVVHAGGTGTKHNDIQNSIYQNRDWAKGYDVVVHNECFADDIDPDYIERVLAPHRDGLAAVVVHCTMHTFRGLKTDAFREFLGVSSFRHGPQHPLDVKNLKPEHPILKGFPMNWTTGNEELYTVAKVWPNATVLATAADKKKDASNNWLPTATEQPVIWVNTSGKGRIFGTTLAHNNKTMEDPVYLDLFARGLLWACHKLDENGKPLPGYAAPVKK